MTGFKHILWADTETWNEVDIRAGLHRYAETVEIMLFQWALDDGDVVDHDFTEDPRMPRELLELLRDPSIQLRFHNAAFDRTVMRHAWRQHGLDLPVERFFCTMAQSYAHAMPGSLEQLGVAQGLAEEDRKLKDGKALVQLFCKPRPKNMKLRRATRLTHPVEWQRFREYGRQDVAQMRASSKRLPDWNYRGSELALWHLDQRINDRGFLVDLDLARAAVATAEREKHVIKQRGQELTDGAVESLTQRDKLLLFLLEDYGLHLPDLRAATVEKVIEQADLPDGLRELLRLRLDATTTSVTKYRTLIRAASSDGRLRGTLQFDGAARTRRWAGRLFQPQNLPRPTHKQPVIEESIRWAKMGALDLLCTDVMARLSSSIRGAIIAPQGRKLVVADLSNIEGRGLAWLAGERWKLQAFADFDAGVGADLYAMAYAKAFGVTPEAVMLNKEEGDGSWRQIGKVMELALGYEGGVGAFITFAAVYGIDLEALAEQAFERIPPEVMAEAVDMLKWTRRKHRTTYGLSDKAWLVCESFKRLWRYAHPQTCKLWKDLDTAVRQAIACPKEIFDVGLLRVYRAGAWLRIALPSGQYLCYPAPAIDDKNRITYMGINQYTRKWQRIPSYGGKLCLAKGTQVLTRNGWVAIERIRGGTEVWDGEDWVACAGAIYNGDKQVINLCGVYMTPDHEVLTDEGWKEASQVAGHNRAESRLPDGGGLRWQRWKEIPMVGLLRVRSNQANGRGGLEEAKGQGGAGLLRMQAQGNHKQEENYARNVEAPRVCGVAVDGGSVPAVDAPSIPQLRGAGDSGLPAVGAVVRSLLGRYGSGVSLRSITGEGRQRRALRAGQLPVGDKGRAGEQPAALDPSGRQDDQRAIGGKRGAEIYHSVPPSPWLPLGEPSTSAGQAQPVFDLVNCGPRSRFVVRDGNGYPLIVHNCENATQSISRDVMANGMVLAEERGYEVLLTVHDELITETPDLPEFNAEGLGGLMATNPDWAPGLPLAAAGFEAYRYRKD